MIEREKIVDDELRVDRFKINIYSEDGVYTVKYNVNEEYIVIGRGNSVSKALRDLADTVEKKPKNIPEDKIIRK